MKFKKENGILYPVLKADNEGRILCPFCNSHHIHGVTGGISHRIAHCGGSPLIHEEILTLEGWIKKENGYYIEFPVIELTLCDKILKGDVPKYEFKTTREALCFMQKWLSKKNVEESVFVCFYNPSPEDGLSYRDEHSAILVTHCIDDIDNMVNEYFDCLCNSFAIFEFGSYKEAFKYCIDLKEGV
jgi:hypothetical protein